MTVLEQLAEWADNPDLRVYIQHKLDGPIATTYQGQLVQAKTGVGGWILQAFDWPLGPVDSASVFSGVALNLHLYDGKPEWWPGNGTFGASCRFMRRALIPQRMPNGQTTFLQGIVETLTIRIEDPFDIMPFL